MKNVQPITWHLLILGTMVLLNSCFKEDLNKLPTLVQYTVSPERIIPGDTVIIHAEASDDDNDPLYYQWNSQFGSFLSAQSNSEASWIASHNDGINIIDLEISDGKIVTQHHLPVQVTGSVYDSFEQQDTLWKVSNGELLFQAGSMDLITTDAVRNAIMYVDLLKNMEPPYAIHMDLTLEVPPSHFNADDKYGVYLNLFNIGSDTMVKAIWFRIYPNSTTKNWKMSVLVDNGPTNIWVKLDSTSYGVSDLILGQSGLVNSIKLIVMEDHSLRVYVNNTLLLNKKTLTNQYLSGGDMSRLIIKRFGIRTSAGRVKVDNVFISHQTDLNSSDLFQ